MMRLANKIARNLVKDCNNSITVVHFIASNLSQVELEKISKYNCKKKENSELGKNHQFLNHKLLNWLGERAQIDSVENSRCFNQLS